MKHFRLGNTKLNISKIGIGGAGFRDHVDSKAAKAVIDFALRHGNYEHLP